MVLHDNSTPTADATASARAPARWLAVVAVGVSVFLSALDGSIVALALPPIGAAFHLANRLTSAVILAYAVPLALVILPAGALIGRFRALPQLLLSLLGFAVGTTVCAVAPSFGVLIFGRALQGAAAGVLSTLGFAVAAGIVGAGERGRAMGIVGSLAPLGAIAGPGIGGQILAHGGWSLIFLVNLPFCAAAALLGIISLGGFRVGSGHRSPVRSAAAGSPPVSTKRPAARLLGGPAFIWSLMGFLGSVTIGSALGFLLPFDLHGIHLLGPATSGLVLLCMPLGMGVAGFLGGFLADRYGRVPLTVAGSASMLIVLALVAPALVRPIPAAGMAWRLALLGVAMALYNSPNQAIMMSVGSGELMGIASALSNLSARIGGTLGPLLIGTLWGLVPGLEDQMRIGGILALALGAATLGCATMVALRKGVRRTGSSLNEASAANKAQIPS